MTKEKILEGNRIIAMFDTNEPEVLKRDLLRAGTLESMHYHDQWEWIMPVVVKIQKLVIEYDEEFAIEFYKDRKKTNNICIHAQC